MRDATELKWSTILPFVESEAGHTNPRLNCAYLSPTGQRLLNFRSYTLPETRTKWPYACEYDYVV